MPGTIGRPATDPRCVAPGQPPSTGAAHAISQITWRSLWKTIGHRCRAQSRRGLQRIADSVSSGFPAWKSHPMAWCARDRPPAPGGDRTRTSLHPVLAMLVPVRRDRRDAAGIDRQRMSQAPPHQLPVRACVALACGSKAVPGLASTSSARTPRRPSSLASIRPQGPPPATGTSAWSGVRRAPGAPLPAGSGDPARRRGTCADPRGTPRHPGSPA